MKLLNKFVLLFMLVFLGLNSFSQKDHNKYTLYKKVVNIEIQNDSLSEFILSLKSQLHEAEIKGDTFQIAEKNLFLAKLYYKVSSFDIAIEYNLVALELFEEVKDTTYIIYSLQNISAMYGYIGSSDISIDYSMKNLKFCELIKDTAYMEGCYINLATSNMKLGNVATSFEYFDKALEFAKVLDDNRLLVYINNNIGTYYFHINSIDSAYYFFTKSLSFIKDKANNYNTAAIYSNLAETAYYLGNYNIAIENAKKSLVYFEDVNMVTDASNSYQILIKAMTKLGKSDGVIEYLNKYIEIKEAAHNKRKAEHAAKLKIIYDINSFEMEIDVLTAENELNESKLLTSKLQLYLAYVIIFLAFVIISVIIIQNSRIRKSHKKIVDENIKTFNVEAENIKLKKVIKNENIISTFSSNGGGLEDNNNDKEMFSRILELLETSKLYTNSDFNLNMLAKELSTNRSYVSKAINKEVNKTFVELINDYRVNESKRLLLTKEITKQLTIEAIGRQAGFKSKSTFFRVFKSIAGVTPSFFLSNVDNSKLG